MVIYLLKHMKKILTGLFVFGFLIIGIKVYAEPNPSNILISPVSGSTFKAGQTVDIRWDNSIQGFTYGSDSCTSSCFQDVIIKYNDIEIKNLSNINNDGQETIKIPINTPAGEYKVYLGWNNYSTNLSGEELVGTFYVSSSSDTGCSTGA